jgi:adenylate cyclase
MHRILLIEDDDLLREGLRQLLEEDGCQVLTAADGAGGMAILRGREIDPCMIVLDLMMPGMNGWDFLQLKGRHPALARIPIAVASAYPFAEKEVLPGVVLRKPFSPTQLRQIISEHCLCASRAARAVGAHPLA